MATSSRGHCPLSVLYRLVPGSADHREQVPGVKLLLKPLSTLPDPMSLDAVTLMAAVNPGPKVLLLMQALALPFAINMPVEPGPLIVAL